MLAANRSEPPAESAPFVMDLGRRVLVGNSLWNLAGDGLPLLVAVFCLPAIIGGMGKERFGLLTICWMMVGYLSLLDMGLGRALTKFLAEKIALRREEEIAGLFWTAFILMTVLGLAGTCGLLLSSRWIVYHGFNVQPALRSDTLIAIRIIAFGLPVLISVSACRGLFAALQRFDLINTVRIPVSVFSFAAPLGVLWYSRSLALIVGVLIAGRAVAWAVQMFLCFQIVPALGRRPRIDRDNIQPLLTFGGWLTVTMVVGPLLVYSDRLLVGSVLSMTSVAYYSTPFEIIYKLQLLPAAIAQVMFPAFSYSLVKSPERVAALLEQANKWVLGLLFPLALLMVIFAPEILRVWLGSDFQSMSAGVTRLFAISLLLAGVTYLPSALIQAAGRPDLYAKLVLMQAPIYLPIAWVCVSRFGIAGAGVASLARVAVNTAACFLFVMQVLPAAKAGLKRSVILIACSVGLMFVGAVIPGGIAVKAIFAAVILAVAASLGWKMLLDQEERGMVLTGLDAIRSWI